jgi:hypothetical protein
MNRQYEMLREKMEKFNAWEAKNRRNLTLEDRLKTFLALYDLGQMHGEDVIDRVHREHLRGLVDTNKRLRDAKMKSERTH